MFYDIQLSMPIVFSLLTFFTSLISLATDRATCAYGQASVCTSDEFCVQLDKHKAECRTFFHSPPPLIHFPFEAEIPILCDQGPLSPIGNSHTYLNTAFAVDLQSPRALADVSVLAGIGGTAFVTNDCSTENDQCGNGFGNSVKIFTDDGYIVFYAHLKKTLIKSGDWVSVGQSIGIEGTTGWAGKNNRHLHLSVHSDWRPMGRDYWQQVGYLPPSIPFELPFCVDGCNKTCSFRFRDVRDLDCLRVSPNSKPFCGR
jgi:hypothetical protein